MLCLFVNFGYVSEIMDCPGQLRAEDRKISNMMKSSKLITYINISHVFHIALLFEFPLPETAVNYATERLLFVSHLNTDSLIRRRNVLNHTKCK